MFFLLVTLVVAVNSAIVGSCTRIKCAEHNKCQFEAAPERIYAGYMKVAATLTSVNLRVRRTQQ